MRQVAANLSSLQQTYLLVRYDGHTKGNAATTAALRQAAMGMMHSLLNSPHHDKCPDHPRKRYTFALAYGCIAAYCFAATTHMLCAALSWTDHSATAAGVR